MLVLERKKRGQATVFVILAIIIVASVLGYFVLRERVVKKEVSANLKQVEEYFLNCIEDETKIGIEILGSRGGYIYLPEFVPGSEYMPTSNQLNFLGSPIPFWYYVSGNNIVGEQAPSKKDMEKQLEKYLDENLDCDFSDFRARGYEIDLGSIKSKVVIFDGKISVDVKADLDVSFGGESYRFTEHKGEIGSKLGKFYDEAIKIYNYEKKESFLENYAVDVLRLYAPVDGVELSCSPKVWLKQEVDNTLKEALEANLQFIRFDGKEGNYFSQDLIVGNDVRVLYDRKWPTRIEVWDSNNGVMMAEPIGNQPGLGILGFCYAPYHFVYDIVFPVLIQVYDEKERFQFPIVVIIDKNKAREALPVTNILDSEPELCKYPINEITVYTYNTNLEPVEADISFECLGQRCDIGKTKLNEKEDATLKARFPQCLNGFIFAEAEGYAIKRYQFSTNQVGEANIILDKLYDLDLELRVNGKKTSDRAIISFVSQENIQTVAWPEQKQVRLSEGLYNITVFVYKNASITIPGINKEICNEVPRPGLLGIFGMTEEKCFDVNIPGQTLTNVVSGGGKGSDYFIESQLEKGKIIVSVSSLPLPKSLEELQDTYNLLEVKSVYIEFE